MFKFSEELTRLAKRVAGQHGPQIRLMRADDLDEVLRIIRLHDSDDYKAAKHSFANTRFNEPLETIAHFVLIDEVENRPVAVSGYYIDDLEAQGVYWLGWTYVNPFFRGKGYGGAIMECVLSALKEIGARKCFLSTSSLPKYQTAVGFYERYGFVQEGCLKDYYADDEHQLLMGVNMRTVPTFKKRHWSKPTPKPEHYSSPQTPSRRPPKKDKREDDDKDVVFEF